MSAPTQGVNGEILRRRRLFDGAPHGARRPRRAEQTGRPATQLSRTPYIGTAGPRLSRQGIRGHIPVAPYNRLHVAPADSMTSTLDVLVILALAAFGAIGAVAGALWMNCLLYTSPSPRD